MDGGNEPANCDDSCRGVAQSGSVSEWGSEGRWFKSTRPDQFKIKPPNRRFFNVLTIFLRSWMLTFGDAMNIKVGLLSCESGGTGRRTGFRIQPALADRGSNPLSRTNPSVI